MLQLGRPCLAAALAVGAVPAWAHDGREHGGPGWTLDLQITLPLALILLLFLAGQRRLGERSRLPRKRSWMFAGGWLVLALALVTPLHEGGERSFTLHMIEHELIMLVATLLLAASRAGGTLAWGLPEVFRKSLAGGWARPFGAAYRALTEPLTATAVQALAMWVWHAPWLFDRALRSDGWHFAQHASFVVSSLLFWTAMLDRRRASPLLAAGCLFATSLAGGALGALMALSDSPWYRDYAAMDMSGIGLDPATDQHLAGLIMWIPGGLFHGAAALILLASMFRLEGRSRAGSSR